MPFYDYQARNASEACPHCRAGFEVFQHMRDEKLTACPECGGPVERLVSGKPMIIQGSWPRKSLSMGCAVREIPATEKRLREAGIPTKFNHEGDAILESPQHRKKLAEFYGMIDKNSIGGRYDPKPPEKAVFEDTGY
jgi:putative FmdB family regulatory protein